MGTPVTRPTTPLPNQDTCDWCKQTIYSLVKERCSHHLCATCSDTYCPLCFTLLLPIRKECYMFNACHEKRRLVGSFFELGLEFIYGYLYDITVLSSDRNCRLQCAWAGEVFDIVLYRHRLPYTALPPLLSNTPGLLFSIHVLPPNLDAPVFAKTPCSWRFFAEMFRSALDRPEVARLDLLPDTTTAFLERCCHSPQQLFQLWQFHHPFPKYRTMFFATSQDGLLCLQCGQAYTSLEGLIQCLGGPLAKTTALLDARPISIKIENKHLFKSHTINAPFPTFRDFWRQWPTVSSAPKLQTGVLSLLCTIRVEQPVTRQNLALYIDHLFNSRVQKFICFDLVFSQNADQLVTSTSCWVCRPINSLPPSATRLDGLEKFPSLCYLSLHKNALRSGQLYHTPQATYSLWRDLCVRSVPQINKS